MLLTPIDPMRRLVTASVGLVLAGLILFLYGMFLSNPALYTSVLSVRASLLGQEITDIMIQQTLPHVPEQLFILAALLIIAGASLDVWRRLHVQFGSHLPISNDPFEMLGHDHIDEIHILS
jgi:hypothetical protein